jgi:hypothetical protein
MYIYWMLISANESGFRIPGWAPYIAGLVILLGALTLTIALVQISRVRKRLMVATLPLVAEQTVRFPSAGDYILHAEGPQLSMLFWGLKYSLVDLASGAEVNSFPTLMHAQSSTLRRARIALRRFFVQREGEHLLRVNGLQPGRDTSKGKIIFSSSWPARDYLWIVLAVGGGLTLMAGFFALLLLVS